MKTKAFYLKANRQDYYTYWNLGKWVDVIKGIENSRIFLLCDNPDVVEGFKDYYKDFSAITVIVSEREDPLLSDIASYVLSKRWEPAGYAHLTTFFHATREGFGSFFNIDGDDTYMAMPEELVRETLKEVENRAEKDGIHAFSLDMHVSKLDGFTWTFGITYIDNTVNWFRVMLNYAAPYQEMRSILEGSSNLDWYFTFLRERTDYRLESFYVENMRFVHSNEHMLLLVPYSGVYYWEKGRWVASILKDVLDAPQIGDVPIYRDVIKLDIDLKREESIACLQDYTLVSQYLNRDTFNIEYDLCNKLKTCLRADCIPERNNVERRAEFYHIDKTTVVLRPYDKNMSLPYSLWESLAEKISTLGLKVVSLVESRMIPIGGTQAICVNKEDSLSLCKKALAVVSLNTPDYLEAVSSEAICFLLFTERKYFEEESMKRDEDEEDRLLFLCDSEEKAEKALQSIVKIFSDSLNNGAF